MAASLEYLAPSTLTIDKNLRESVALGREFIASIRERGVLEPILGYRSDDETVHVIAGQRRTLGAREAGADLVPVVVLDDGPPAEVDRLVDQWTENEHRAELTNTDRVQAIQDMLDAGLSVAQVAKRTATPKAQVGVAVTVAASTVARGHVDQLTLEQAATLAEFEDDAEAVDFLLNDEEPDSFDYRATELRNSRAVAAAEAATVADLIGAGLTVIDWNTYGQDRNNSEVSALRTDDGEKIDADTHAACPGHAVAVRAMLLYGETEPTVTTYPICADWKANGHRHAWNDNRSEKKPAAEQTEEERAAARAQRAHVIESNKAWKTATQLRRARLPSLGQRKSAPAGSEAYLASMINAVHSPTYAAHDLVGLERHTVAEELPKATPKRALGLALALAVGAWEADTSDDTWRSSYDEERTRYTLRMLSQWGHQLSEIETRIVENGAG